MIRPWSNLNKSAKPAAARLTRAIMWSTRDAFRALALLSLLACPLTACEQLKPQEPQLTTAAAPAGVNAPSSARHARQTAVSAAITHNHLPQAVSQVGLLRGSFLAQSQPNTLRPAAHRKLRDRGRSSTADDDNVPSILLSNNPSLPGKQMQVLPNTTTQLPDPLASALSPAQLSPLPTLQSASGKPQAEAPKPVPVASPTPSPAPLSAEADPSPQPAPRRVSPSPPPPLVPPNFPASPPLNPSSVPLLPPLPLPPAPSSSPDQYPYYPAPYPAPAPPPCALPGATPSEQVGSTPPASGSGRSLSPGLLAVAVAVPALAVLAAAVLGAVWLRRRRARNVFAYNTPTTTTTSARVPMLAPPWAWQGPVAAAAWRGSGATAAELEWVSTRHSHPEGGVALLEQLPQRWYGRRYAPAPPIRERIGESMQRPLELCIWLDLEALPASGKEYQQGYKLANDRLPKVMQRVHRAAEYRRGVDGRARNNP
ncbi:hypothetical protein QJQ45_008906 [Haematococcus lacustris]|nr:hypothetical protein QJQ45_008906 [Haematococcus lacustris]